jgi:hypothetical protein
MVLVLSPTVGQARIVIGYLQSFLESSRILQGAIVKTTAVEIHLRSNIVVAVHPPSYRSVRGRTLLAAIFDESAYWRDETSASPDVEVYRAVLPSLATTQGMLIGIGSPYRRTGLLFSKYRDNFGKDIPDTLVVQAETQTLNPTIDHRVIEAAERDDPQAALSEWRGLCRTDLASVLDEELINQAVNHGRPLELPPHPGIAYRAFVDPSGGRHDAFVIAIAHRERAGRIVADVIRGTRPPFDPQAVVREYAKLVHDYRCPRIRGDNYAGEWVAAAFKQAGISYEQSELNKSELYLEGLPIFTRGLIELPDQAVLLRELRLLERRTTRAGRDSVDHGVAGSDDHANALFGAINLCTNVALNISADVLARSRMPGRASAPGMRLQGGYQSMSQYLRANPGSATRDRLEN